MFLIMFNTGQALPLRERRTWCPQMSRGGHAEYPREKFVEILRRTWRKLSPRAQELAGSLALPPEIAALVRDAVAEN